MWRGLYFLFFEVKGRGWISTILISVKFHAQINCQAMNYELWTIYCITESILASN